MNSLVKHNLAMHKVQSASIIISVALSVMILMTFGLVYGGVQQGIELSEEQSGADVMAIPADSLQYIEDTELLYTGAPAPIYMSEDIVAELAAVEGVERVSAQFYSQTLNSACCSSTGETRLIGIDIASDFVVRALAGDDAVDALRDNTVIIGCDVDGVYDGVLTVLDEDYTVVGTMAETGTSFDASIIGAIDMVRDISLDIEGYEHYWEKYGQPDELISCVMIDIADDDDGTALTAVQACINLSGTASPLVRSETAEKAAEQLQSVFFLLVVVAIIMLIITLLQLASRFYNLVWERKSELALYRAIGASTAALRKLIASEVSMLVGTGLLVGIVLGLVAHGCLLSIMQNSLAFPYITPGFGATVILVCSIFLIFAVVSLLSVIVPLRQISKLDPSTVMQQGDID